MENLENSCPTVRLERIQDTMTDRLVVATSPILASRKCDEHAKINYINGANRMAWIFKTAILFSLLMASPAIGAEVTYLSNPLTSGDPPGPGLGVGVLDATFNFTSPLISGVTLTEDDIDSWSMSANGRTINSGNATFFDAEFTFGATMLPTTWGFTAELNLEADAEPETIYSANRGSGFYSQEWDIVILDDLHGNSPSFSGLSAESSGVMNSPGTFSVTAIPEPSTFGFIAFAGLWFSTRRRRRAA